MKKISELTVVHYGDASNGMDENETINEETSFQVSRPVNTVKGLPRFGHYLLDMLIMSLLIFGIIIPGALLDEQFMNGPIMDFFNYGGSYLVFVGFYFVCEITMQRTPGKFATGSIVINEYAQKPSGMQLLGRSFARLIPFEALSCLGERGWHDTFSNTYVVTLKERDELLRLLNEEDPTEASLIVPEEL